MNKHPGFKAAAASIARKQGMPMMDANAILAAGARHAGKKAVMANPHLLSVKRRNNPHGIGY